MQKQLKSMLVKKITASLREAIRLLLASLLMFLVFFLYLPFLVINPYKHFLKWLENIISSKTATL